MIFASIGHAVIDIQQMKGRLTSVDHPKPCIYYWLLAEGKSWDRKIYTDVVENGIDFDIHRHQ